MCWTICIMRADYNGIPVCWNFFAMRTTGYDGIPMCWTIWIMCATDYNGIPVCWNLFAMRTTYYDGIPMCWAIGVKQTTGYDGIPMRWTFWISGTALTVTSTPWRKIRRSLPQETHLSWVKFMVCRTKAKVEVFKRRNSFRSNSVEQRWHWATWHSVPKFHLYRTLYQGFRACFVRLLSPSKYCSSL